MVGAVTALSGFLALACIWVGTLAVENNFDAFSAPVLTLQYAHHFELAKWFNLLDLFGYYLLLLPVVFYFHQQYQYRSPWMPLITFSGAAYALLGALGAAILAALWPEQMKDYLSATPEDKTLITAIFSTSTILVTKGIWNILEMVFAAVWWIGLGKLFLPESKSRAVLTMLTGLVCLLDVLGNMFNLHLLSEIGMNIYLLLGIAWPIGMGVHLMKKVGTPDEATAGHERTITSPRRELYENA